MGAFALDELDVAAAEDLWRRGGFPDSLLGPDEEGSVRWRRNFTDTLIERDLPQRGVRVSATAMRRFRTVVAHYHDQGAEIDLLLHRRGKLFGVECKRVDAPRMTPSMRIALADQGLERIAVIYPGARRHALADRVEAVPLATLAEPGRLFGE